MKRTINKPKESITYFDDENKPLNVCAYCRVSTNDDDQRNSFEAQKHFFDSEFRFHDNWKKKTIFADKGISGTSLNHRDEFNKMISLAMKKEYDLIITKEVSRFSRNIQDLINIVEDLRKINVFVYFMTDDINTQKPDYRERLISAGNQAEAESRKTSKRVKWGQQRKMEQGVVFGRREMLGYNIVKIDDYTQQFEIIPEEAEIVKMIFNSYVYENKGTFQIARMLEQKGIKTKRYKNGWSNTVILRVLRNEKYVGDLMLGKTYTPDFLTHKKKYNRENEQTYYFTDHHPEQAIITRTLWDKAQARLLKNSPSEESKAKHSNRYWCSGKVFCGVCGQRFVSHNKKLKATDENGNNLYSKRWTCWEQQNHGTRKKQKLETGEIVEVGCINQTVSDKTLKICAIDIIEAIIKPEIETIKEKFLKIQEKELSKFDENNDKIIAELNEELQTIKNKKFNAFDEFNDKRLSKSDYDFIIEKYKDQETEIEKKLNHYKSSNYEKANKETELEIRKMAFNQLLEYKDQEANETMLHNLIDKIKVYPNNYLEYYFYFQEEPIIVSYKTSGRMDNYKVVSTWHKTNPYFDKL